METLAEIITVGDELLIGQVVDTNSAWMGQKLNDIGIRVHQITSVSDNEQHIMESIDNARKRVQIILMTGGLGPTKDDITKITLCKYFKTDLRFDEAAYKNVERIFKARGREVTPLNRKQAEVPSNCTVIVNTKGTAPGMWFEMEEKVLISMPGVPYEMKEMMEQTILPQLQSRFAHQAIYHKTILTQGIGESFLSEIVEEWENQLPSHIKLAYLPSPGVVRLRLSGKGSDKKQLESEIAEQVRGLKQLAGDYIYGYDNETLEILIGKLLSEKGKTLSTAESCTGGYIAHKITSIAGSSKYFKGGIVAYSNEMKEKFLDVSANTLKQHGAVSEQTVIEMAEGAAKNLKTDFAIAVSGIAGPDGGTPDKPVGTVWLGIKHPEGMFTRKLQLGSDRGRIILETSLHALNNLRKILI